MDLIEFAGTVSPRKQAAFAWLAARSARDELPPDLRPTCTEDALAALEAYARGQDVPAAKLYASLAPLTVAASVQVNKPAFALIQVLQYAVYLAAWHAYQVELELHTSQLADLPGDIVEGSEEVIVDLAEAAIQAGVAEQRALERVAERLAALPPTHGQRGAGTGIDPLAAVGDVGSTQRQTGPFPHGRSED